MSLLNRPSLVLAALAAFFVNPMFACVVEPEFQYGVEEMRAAVEGTWELALTFSDGRAQAVTVAIEQDDAPASPTAAAAGTERSLVRPAAACGTRTLVKSAEACGSSTEMPLAVTFLGGDESLRSTVMSGNFVVRSLLFSRGDLSIRVGDVLVVGTVSSAGEASDFVISTGAIRSGVATLVRTSP